MYTCNKKFFKINMIFYLNPDIRCDREGCQGGLALADLDILVAVAKKFNLTFEKQHSHADVVADDALYVVFMSF